jgi:WD40 repeat protein
MKMNNPTRTVLTGAVAWMVCSIAGAAEPPPTPFLRIEAGMHTGIIEAIDTDANGRYAVTVSDDKTARVWELPAGRSSAILRPPTGLGDRDKLSAVAMSPDGETVVVAGVTWTREVASSHFYVFSRRSGQLVRRLPDLPFGVMHLAFSPDGQWLAVGSGQGLRVLAWKASNASPASWLPDPDTHWLIESLTWSADNRLAVLAATPMDYKQSSAQTVNQIRLYQLQSGQLTVLLHVPLGVGATPVAYGVASDIAFSPDGRYLALSVADTEPVAHPPSKIVVVDSHTLQSQYALDAGRSESGDLWHVAWSRDGHTLYAAGDAHRNNAYYVRAWPAREHGSPIDVPTNGGRIYQLRTWPGNQGQGAGVLVSGEVEWGIVDGAAHWRAAPTHLADFFPTPDNRFTILPVSRDGREVQFQYREGAAAPQLFSIVARRLQPLGNSPALSPPTKQDGDEGRTARAPDGRYITTRSGELDFWDAADGPVWQQVRLGSVPLIANIPASGKMVVAGYADGTIRWHRLSDGKELLAFFPHPDGKRWVLWTPTGYYDASPGGEELIGWHVDRGSDHAADFFPAARFRNRFYRPDVIDRVLDTLDESQAVLAANAARGNSATTQANVVQILPPVVELMSATEVSASQTQLPIRYRTRSTPDAPVTRVFARVNGLVQSTARRIDVVGADGSQEMLVQLPAEDSEVQLFAENRNGASTAAKVHVKWIGAVSPPAAVARTSDSAGFQIQPKLYVLAIGVSAYQNKDIPKLAFAAKDAQDFAQSMQRQQSKLYKNVEVKILADDKATKDEILDDLEWLQKQVTQHDVGMLFLSGHGTNDASLGFVYLPVDADLAKLKRTGVSMADIKTTLSSIAGKAVAFLDTCHSGNIWGAGQKGLNDMSGVINELASAENGLVVFSSSTGRQFSLENASWNNGAFTKALVEGIDGRADEQHSGRVTYKMLDLYVSERVKVLTQGNQSPVTQAPGGINDFPLALTE